MTLKNYLISPNERILDRTAHYITNTLGYTLTDKKVITNTKDFKMYTLSKPRSIFYLNDINLFPWTIKNLQWAIAVHKEYSITIYYVDLKASLCTDVNGNPATLILNYLQTLNLPELNNDL